MKTNSEHTKQPCIFLICGDYWHAPACADYIIHQLCRELDYSLTTAMTHQEVPWNDFAEFDAIVLYKEGRYSHHDSDARWLSLEQEQQLVNFTRDGGTFIGLHSGVCSYAVGGPMREMMRGHFVHHPPELTYKVLPKQGHPFCQGIEPFELFDEMYVTDVVAEQTDVFLESEALEHGRLISGWTHQYGAGRFIGLTPGHNVNVMTHPMMAALLKNILNAI